MKLTKKQASRLLIKEDVISNYNIVKYMLEIGANPSYKNNSAIKLACYEGHTKVVELLLKDKRVDPSAGDNFAIRWAKEYRYKKIIKLLSKDERVDTSIDNEEYMKIATTTGEIY